MKKTNSFKGIAGGVTAADAADQQAINGGALNPYEQLDTESEALISKLSEVVSVMYIVTSAMICIILDHV